MSDQPAAPERLRLLRLKQDFLPPRIHDEDVDHLVSALNAYGFCASETEIISAWRHYSIEETQTSWQPTKGYTETMLFRRLAPYFNVEPFINLHSPSPALAALKS